MTQKENLMSEKVGRIAEAVSLSGLGIGLTSEPWVGARIVNPL